MILVQHICVHWTKLSRGGTAASHRNSVPESLALPTDYLISDSAQLVLHSVTFHEPFHEPSFDPSTGQVVQFSELPSYVAGTTSFDVSGDELRVIYRYHLDHVGIPDRVSVDKAAFSLQPGQRGRIVYNGRFVGSDGHWFYRKNAINIAWNATMDDDLFVAKPPDATFEDLARLR